MQKWTCFICCLVIALSCVKDGLCQLSNVPEAPDYSDLYNWAVHPDKDSPALAVPGKGRINKDELLEVDIFYIHPTTYFDMEGKPWNADIRDAYLNEQTDGRAIKNQASIFNQLGEIYAPRYRQANIKAYSLPEGEKRSEIFNIAYQDVKNSFEYFIKNLSVGKPFVIASHSQGTTHSKRLVKEVIDTNEDLKSRMIVAYLLGMDVKKNEFDDIRPCQSPKETGCFTAWRTIRMGKEAPRYFPKGDEYVATNPLTWSTQELEGSKSDHLGAILKNFNKVRVNATETLSKDGILYASRPKFPFSFLFKLSNYHILDFNLFYFNIQQNVLDRSRAYLSDNQ